jgi:hypothetical protein
MLGSGALWSGERMGSETCIIKIHVEHYNHILMFTDADVLVPYQRVIDGQQFCS